MGPSNGSYLSNTAIVHFHDYGWTSIGFVSLPIFPPHNFSNLKELQHFAIWNVQSLLSHFYKVLMLVFIEGIDLVEQSYQSFISSFERVGILIQNKLRGSMGMVYLPTFTIKKIKEMSINIPVPWILWDLNTMEISGVPLFPGKNTWWIYWSPTL